MKTFTRYSYRNWMGTLSVALILSTPLHAADEENGDNFSVHKFPIKRDIYEITAAFPKDGESKNFFDFSTESTSDSLSVSLKFHDRQDSRIKRRRMMSVAPSLFPTKEIKSFSTLKDEIDVLVSENNINLEKTIVALDFDGTVAQLVFGDASSPFVLAGSPEWNDLYLKEFSSALHKIGKSPGDFESLRLSIIEEYRYQVLDQALISFLEYFPDKQKQVVILSGLKCDGKKESFLKTLGISHYIYGKAGKAKALATFLAADAVDVEHILFVDNNKAKGIVAFNTTITKELKKQSKILECEKGITIHPFYYSKMEDLLSTSKDADEKSDHKTLEEELEEIFKNLEKQGKKDD